MSGTPGGQRITYIHQHFKPPTENGGGRPYEFARRLATAGHDVTMVAAGQKRRSYEIGGFTVEEIPTRYDNAMSVPRRILSFVNFMVRACWVAARQPADTVFASSTPLTVVIPGILAARLRRARFVVEIRDLWPSVPVELGFLPSWMAPPARALERIAYAEADSIIALSPSMAKGVLSVRPTSTVHVVPNASDTSAARPDDPCALRESLGVSEGTLMFAYAGSLGVGYDPQWLARLAIALRPHDAQLIVVGAGKGLEEASRLLRESGIDPNGVFLGARSRQAALEVVSVSDVAVSSLFDHPCLEGNSLNKVFDALAVERPVVFNHDGWLSQLVTEVGAGWRWPRDIEPADVASLLVSVRSGQRAASNAAGKLARTKFDREDLFNEFTKALLGDH